MNDNNTVSGVEPARSRKGATVAGISAGVLVVAVGGGIAAYSMSDYVKNQVKLAVSSPEKYYSWVVSNNSKNTARKMSEKYKNSLEMYSGGQNTGMSLKYELSDEVRTMLMEEFDGDENQEIADLINNMNDVKLGISTSSRNSSANGNIYAEVNGQHITSVDIAADTENLDMFFRIPELSEQWIYSSLSDDTNNIAVDDFRKAFRDAESIITPEEIESLVLKYSEIYNNHVSEVSLEKKEAVEIGAITVDYTVVSVDADADFIKNLMTDFAETAKNDELLKSIIVDRTETATSDEYVEAFDDFIADIDSSVTSGAVLSTYIDPKGCIRGFGIDEPDGNSSARAVIGMDGDNICGEIRVSENDEDVLLTTLSMTESDGKYSGTLDMLIEDMTASADFSDIEIINKEKGYVSGNVSVFSSDDTSFSLSLESDGNSQKISSALIFDDVNYGNATIEMSISDSAEINIPDKNSSYDINSDSANFPSDYVEQDVMNKFLSDIFGKLGIDSKTGQETAEIITGSVYGNDFGGYDPDDAFTYDDDIDSDFSLGSNKNDDKDDVKTEGDDTDNDLIKDSDFDYDDLQDILSSSDPYYNDIVMAENGDAYMIVVDSDYTSSYMGYLGGTLAYDAKVAKISGDGNYSVKVTADSDGYKNMMDDIKPNGFYMLGFAADGIKNVENVECEIVSL
ncbi:MAG: hypothetical protein K2N49_02830, partial [Ruminococcus sp.]|nr:hypothetical protein [Ruminococcus sp.]